MSLWIDNDSFDLIIADGGFKERSIGHGNAISLIEMLALDEGRYFHRLSPP